MIYCQPGDCDNCKYDDCIGTIKGKPGRKKLPAEEKRRRKNERARIYRATHKEEIRKYMREHYLRKKNS